MIYIKNLFYFYFNPSKEITLPLSVRSKIFSIFYFFLLEYSFLLIFICTRYFLVLKNIVPPLSYDSKMEAITNSFFFSVLLGPLLEEILFRLWLVYSKINVSITIAYLLLWISGLVFHIYWFDTVKLVVYFILSFITLFTLLFFLLKRYELATIFETKFIYSLCYIFRLIRH